MTDSRSSAEPRQRSGLPLITAAVVGALAILASWLGPLVFRGLVVVVVLFGAREMALLVSREGAPLPEWGAPIAAALFAVFAQSQRESAPITVAAGIVLFMMTFFLLGIFGVRSGKLRSMGGALLIALYVGMLGSFLVLIRLVDIHGTRLTAALILMISAYQVGRTLGEGRVPGWRGVLIGIAACVSAGAISLLFLRPPFTPVPVLAISLVVGISAVVGDLAGDMIRADSGIGEREATIPGRGGLLLWMHPLLLGAPAFFYSLRLYLT